MVHIVTIFLESVAAHQIKGKKRSFFGDDKVICVNQMNDTVKQNPGLKTKYKAGKTVARS
jgi:hypothetical protein